MSEESDSFYRHLEENGVGQEHINAMKKEKINATIISLMDDETLGKYLATEGDRILARNYAKRDKKQQKPLTSLLDRLRTKFEKVPKSDKNVHGGSKNAIKPDRKIEIGWMDFDFNTNTYKQVRTRNGGGTRGFKISKSATNSDIMEKAIDIFFPRNISPKGALGNFEYTLLDYKLDDLEDVNVGTLYDRTNMKILRFYLCTKAKTNVINADDSDELESIPDILSSNTELATITSLSTASSADNSGIISFGPFSGEGNNETTLPMEDIVQSALFFSNISAEDIEDIPPPPPYIPRTSTPRTQSTVESIRATQSTFIIDVKRNDYLNDMIFAFENSSIMDCEIVISVLLPSGKREKGEGSGVLVDCLTGFWEEMYEKCTLGTQEKVPCLRHDFKEIQWQAMARILLYGWEKFEFIPTQISKVFLHAATGNTPGDDDLINSFMNFVGNDERQILNDSLNDFDNTDFDELIEVLGEYGCKKLPTKESLRKLVCEIAHKELLQKPMYILDSWRNIFLETGSSSMSLDHINEIYKESVPQPRKLLKRLKFPVTMNEVQRATSNHLQRFVRDADPRTLKRILRFCTGFNILLKQNETINVMFQGMSEFCRRPIGRTCGQILQLADEYPSYTDFRSEMNAVLDSGILTMDII